MGILVTEYKKEDEKLIPVREVKLTKEEYELLNTFGQVKYLRYELPEEKMNFNYLIEENGINDEHEMVDKSKMFEQVLTPEGVMLGIIERV